MYLRTGAWLSIVTRAPKGRPVVRLLIDHKLPTEGYSLEGRTGRELRIAGGSAVAVLYGVYRMAETMGVRFDLYQDVLPDSKIPFHLPRIQETRRPLFALRGLQPFHDFPEGPDWWSQDDYVSSISRMPRLGMNFIGFHCYPEGGVGPEPLVWIGRESDLNADGSVRNAYASRWASAAGGTWGYAGTDTNGFASGASGLFAGLPVFRSDGPDHDVSVFERAASMIRPAFQLAHDLGVRTCVGTETPLTLPKVVAQRMSEAGSILSPDVTRSIYRAMFRRIQAAYRLDYYWLWTPEDWTWSGNKPEQYAATLMDMRAALGALEDLGDPFQLATCGWVLGPANDRAALDKDLPKSVPLSAINRDVGHAPIDPAFGEIRGRPLWAIPWLENDPNLVGYQPWVGRMRADAAQARVYGCTGLFGIHWRTASIGMNIVALAEAGWDQSWSSARTGRPSTAPSWGALGGQVAQFSAPVDARDQDPVYQSVRYDAAGYRLEIPDGVYRVRLLFNEPYYTAPGKRVFGVNVQGRRLVRGLDLFARVGRNHALDLAVDSVRVEDGMLRIDFFKEVEYPCIAGIEVTGRTATGQPYSRRINCGGPAWGDFEEDQAADTTGRGRSMPTLDFYIDWATARFGPEIGKRAGEVFASIDGVAFPQLTDWLDGPGGLPSVSAPWGHEKARFAFLDKLESLRPRIRGKLALSRFDVWLERFRFAKGLRELSCTRGELDREVAGLSSAEPGTRKNLVDACLRTRIRLARQWEATITHLMASVETSGELGTIENLEAHTRLHNSFLTVHDAALASALGSALPSTVYPVSGNRYTGPSRLFLLTHRDLYRRGSTLVLPITLLAGDGTGRVRVYSRALGTHDEPRELDAVRLSGYQWTFHLPVSEDLEYWIEAETTTGERLRYPPSTTSFETVLATDGG